MPFIHKRERSARRLKCLEWASRKICAAAATLRRSVQTSVRPVTAPGCARRPSERSCRRGASLRSPLRGEMPFGNAITFVGCRSRSVGRSLLPSFVQGRSSGVPGVSPLRSFLLSRRPRPSLQPKSVSIAAANCFPFPTFNDRRVSDRHGHGAAQRGVREIWTLRQPLASSGQACLRER